MAAIGALAGCSMKSTRSPDVSGGTMTGEVGSQSKRRPAQDIAAAVPNVLQVVNELQVKR
jgi:BON domain